VTCFTYNILWITSTLLAIKTIQLYDFNEDFSFFFYYIYIFKHRFSFFLLSFFSFIFHCNKPAITISLKKPRRKKITSLTSLTIFLFIYILDRFDAMISKIILKKYIILMYFSMKNILKNNRNYILKQPKLKATKLLSTFCDQNHTTIWFSWRFLIILLLYIYIYSSIASPSFCFFLHFQCNKPTISLKKPRRKKIW
jgi:hypothetical protein